MPDPFHVAVPVVDLDAARQFYGRLLGCPEGRSEKRWIDFDLFGHQFVCHQVDGGSAESRPAAMNRVDGDAVPVPHYGVVLNWPDWERLADKLRASGIEFLIEPRIRFAGEPGEQGTFFVADPSGNVLEFKTFRDQRQLFAR